MVKTKAEIKRIVRDLVQEVSGDYKVTGAILFGSYARGNPREESDIDVAIISPDFQGRPEMEILQYLSRKAMKIDTALEVVAFSQRDLQSADPRSFSYQVKKYGIQVAEQP